MGVVVKEFICHGHGRFDSTEAVCPYGCTLVERVFITPVGVQTARTRSIDATLETIAQEHKLGDINTRRDAHSARKVDPKTRKAMEQQEAMRQHLQKKFTGLNLVDTKAGTGGWGGKPESMSAVPAPRENALESVKDALVKPRTITISDPERLTVKDAKVA